MKRQTRGSKQQPGSVPGLVPGVALALLAAMLLAPGAPALADEVPAAVHEQTASAATIWGDLTAWDETAQNASTQNDAARHHSAWDLPAGPTLVDLARDHAPESQPPVVGLRLRAAPVGLAVEVAEGVHLGAAGDFDPRTDDAVALVALRLSL